MSLSVEGGAVRLAVVADTHGAPHARTAELLREARVDAILHAGDIGDLRVIDDLAAVAPVHAVRGNIDARAPGLPDELAIDLVQGGQALLRLFLVHIAVYGPRLLAPVARSARDAGAAIVVCGHSHVPFIGRDQGLALFNPGSIGPRRSQLPIVFGVIELRDARVTMHHVSCETGARWEP